MDADRPVERVNYFSGQLLAAADFLAEQDYFRARLRRHNRYLHGWGVVCGLDVTIAEPMEVVVEPGVAIDCTGNEIAVCDRIRVKIPADARACFVGLEYIETATSPVAVVDSGQAATDSTLFTRIREGSRLEVLPDNPCGAHRHKGPGTPGCGRPHPICIARIRKKRRGWRVELRGRRPGS